MESGGRKQDPEDTRREVYNQPVGKDIMEYPLVRRGVKVYVHVIVVGVLVCLVLGWRVRDLYHRDFKGMREDQAVTLVGKPLYDERESMSAPSSDYVLEWTHWLGGRLRLKFKNGVVVEQSYPSR
jgi:hypothetical protein